jgi:hypothetical protein
MGKENFGDSFKARTELWVLLRMYSAVVSSVNIPVSSASSHVSPMEPSSARGSPHVSHRNVVSCKFFFTLVDYPIKPSGYYEGGSKSNSELNILRYII